MVKRLIIYVLGVLFFCPSYLLKADNIDSLYSKENYTSIIEHYNSSFDKDMNTQDYFILAQSYYHIGDIGFAILNYERALRLEPNNTTIKHNLEVARLASVDKQNLSPSFLSKILDSLSYSLSPIALIILAIISFIIAVSLFIYFRVALTYKRRKNSFIFSMIFFFFCLVFNAMLIHASYYYNSSNDYAIVTDRKVDVKVTQGKEHTREIHSGYKVRIIRLGDNISTIELPDGTQGQVSTSSITPIATSL